MDNERLQDIKNRGYRRRAISPNDWVTILKDVEELIAALEASQEKTRMCHIQYGMCCKERAALRKQLTASQAEAKRLEDLYNSDRVKYLDDITLLQTEVAELEDMMMLNDPSNCANAIATDDGFLITIDKKKL